MDKLIILLIQASLLSALLVPQQVVAGNESLRCYEVELRNTSLVHCLNSSNNRHGVQKYLSGIIKGSYFIFENGCMVSGHKQGYPSFTRDGDFKVANSGCDGSKMKNGDYFTADEVFTDGEVIQATGSFVGTDPFKCTTTGKCKKVLVPPTL